MVFEWQGAWYSVFGVPTPGDVRYCANKLMSMYSAAPDDFAAPNALLIPTGPLDLRTAEVFQELSETKVFVDVLENHLRELDSPMLADALRKEVKGTLVTMARTGAVVVRDVDKELGALRHQGDHEEKAFEDYLHRIKKGLREEIVEFDKGAACLEYAMNQLALHIHYEHWKAFGINHNGTWIRTWPKPRDEKNSGYQESPISIRLDLIYTWHQDLVVVCMGGNVMVRDERPKPEVYIAKVSGKPKIKYLALKAERIPVLDNCARESGAAEFLQVMKANGEQWKRLTLEDLQTVKSDLCR